MVELLRSMAEEAQRTNPFFGRDALAASQRSLRELPAGAPPRQRWKLLRALGSHQLRFGQNEEALASYEEARRIREQLGAKLRPEEILDTWFDLGLAYLRLGETSNCVAQHTTASCIFPIAREGVHADQRGSRGAMRMFERILQQKPDHWAARWLLNVAAMTLGEYPAKVPPQHLIALQPFEGGVAFPRFVDVAAELDLSRPATLAGGVVADDFDGDGVLDLVTTAWGAADPMRFRKGLPDGTFEDRTREAGLAGITGGLNVTHADYDDDGDLDLFVPRGAWMRQHGRWPRSLLQNDGQGRFVDVSFDAGLAQPMLPTQAAAWADYDNDGDLDLYVGNESSDECQAPSNLFRNDGGKFVDVAAAAGVTNDLPAKGVAWGDYDGDRFPDLYVSNNGHPNRLYHNRRDGTFEDVAVKLGVHVPLMSFSCWWWDYDNDGALDLYVASYYPFVDPFVAWAAGTPIPFEPQGLFKGDGKGGFRVVTQQTGLARPNCTMGSNCGDFDNDGFLDFYLSTGYPGYEGLMPNVAFWNRAGQGFADVTVPAGLGHLQKGHAVSFFDRDMDGDEDVFVSLGGAFPGDGFSDCLFQNPGFGNHWIEVRLEGTRSNRCAIGARIRVDVTEAGKPRSIFRWIGPGSSFGGNPLRQHIGIGRATKVDRLEVYWPTSDLTQSFAGVPAGKRLRVIEGDDELRIDG
jgi:hypothetical protein